MTTYIAYLREKPDGRFAIEFPDLPECVTVGDYPERAIAEAGEDLVRHLTTLLNFGYPAPTPSGEAELSKDPRRGDAQLVAFDVDLEMLGIANPLINHTL